MLSRMLPIAHGVCCQLIWLFYQGVKAHVRIWPIIALPASWFGVVMALLCHERFVVFMKIVFMAGCCGQRILVVCPCLRLFLLWSSYTNLVSSLVVL